MKKSNFNYLEIASSIVILSVAVLWRTLHLDHIPGLNGDDAWLPVQLKALFAGGEYTLHTPSQRLVSPTFALASLPFHFHSSANIWLLRAPTLLASLATIPAVYFLFKRTLSSRAVLILTLLTAALPTSIAYARSMAEMSQIPLFVAFTFGFLIMGWHWMSLISFLVSLSIHPSCFFLLPLLLAIFFYERRKQGRLQVHHIAIAIAGATGIALFVIWTTSYDFNPLITSLIMHTTTRPEQISRFIIGFLRLFSGVTVYQDFAGPLDGTALAWFDMLSILILGIVLLIGGLFCWRRPRFDTLIQGLGILVTLVLFYLFSNVFQPPFEPGFERFSLFLIIPVLLIFVSLLEEIFQTHPALNRWGIYFVFALCGAFLISFHSNYLERIRTTGGSADKVYRTSQVEPKLQAFNWIKSDHQEAANASKIILCEDWWLIWPMTYFASQHQEIKVVGLSPHISFEEKAPAVAEALEKGAFAVGYSGQPLDRFLSNSKNLKLLRVDINDPMGGRILSVWRKQ